MQAINYLYNIRGQLLSINDSRLTGGGLFGMEMIYDQLNSDLYNGTGNTPYHNGKLSAVKWMSKDNSGTNTNERSYIYNYDLLNRITDAKYSERSSSSGSFGTNVDGFNESGISYDENGNILALNRTASTINASSYTSIDQLSYSYSGNKLNSVADASGNSTGFIPGSGTYGYDDNGNIKIDPYKNLINEFNVLNRVDHTVITGNGTIYYTYNGAGLLIRKEQYNTSSTLIRRTDYIDGFEYDGGNLAYFSMPEGRVLNASGTLSLEYSISDQQGNTRVSFDNTGTGGAAKVRQENSFYAFGMTMASVMTGTENKRLYNGGSEWQKDFADNLPGYYQTYYRNYDPALGRFISIDPMAEMYESMTPYHYSGNNPIMYNDPLGDKENINYVSPHGEYDPHGIEAMTAEFERADARLTAWVNGLENSGGGGPIHVYDSNGGGALNQTQFLAIFESLKNGHTPTFTLNNGLISYSYWRDWFKASTGDGVTIGSTHVTGTVAANQGDPSGLRQFIAIAVGEAAGNPAASRSIASTLLNRLDLGNGSLDDPNWKELSIKKLGGTVSGNYQILKKPNEDYNDIMSSKLIPDLRASSNPAIISALQAFDNRMTMDYSNGALFWNATSQKYSQNIGLNFQNAANGIYNITGKWGNTTFFKPSH